MGAIGLAAGALARNSHELAADAGARRRNRASTLRPRSAVLGDHRRPDPLRQLRPHDPADDRRGRRDRRWCSSSGELAWLAPAALRTRAVYIAALAVVGIDARDRRHLRAGRVLRSGSSSSSGRSARWVAAISPTCAPARSSRWLIAARRWPVVVGVDRRIDRIRRVRLEGVGRHPRQPVHRRRRASHSACRSASCSRSAGSRSSRSCAPPRCCTSSSSVACR